jgi:hypothetical protein
LNGFNQVEMEELHHLKKVEGSLGRIPIGIHIEG